MGGAILPVCAAHDNAADEPVSRVLFMARAATRIPPGAGEGGHAAPQTYFCGVSGNRTVNVEPTPGSLSTVMLPPCCWTVP
jgi:hypothetical protein